MQNPAPSGGTPPVAQVRLSADAAPRARLTPGDRMPEFTAATDSNPSFRFDSVGGRWLVLGLIGSAGTAGSAARLRGVMGDNTPFDDRHASLFLVSGDPDDAAEDRLADRMPGRRVFRDHDQAIARLTGALPAAGTPGPFSPRWIVLDPGLTVNRIIPFRQDGSDLAELLAHIRSRPGPEAYLGFAVPAPVLILPDVFEPAFCDHLIRLYDSQGGKVSGFMRDQDGRTVAAHDRSFKVRRDYNLHRPEDIRAAQARILRRVIPQIERVHFFHATRMERYMVGCYDADEGGHFRPHRDNTTLGTAHRRFAVSINLNEDFAGGEVSFPEYGPRGYKGPKGSAVVFSCALLHAVSPVTQGRRYAFLPFLYDEAAAALRARNATMAGAAPS